MEWKVKRISFAHADVDIYQSVWDCCVFIYTRLENGGKMIFDDYGFTSCLEARKPVDQCFKDKSQEPLVLSTGQAVVSNQSSFKHFGLETINRGNA